MKNDILGVIGGLGPLATAHFMEEVVHLTRADTEQDHVDMIVYNFPSIPDRTGYILGSNLRSPLPGLLWAGRALAREQVKCIALPCVTAHFFYEELSDELRCPVINTLKETAEYLRSRGVRSAGIMATQGTVHSGCLSRWLGQAGIRTVLPGGERQEDVNHLIYHNIKKGLPAEMDRFRRTEEELRSRGAEVVILGCTELSLLRRQENLGPGFLDTTQILAREAILRCGKQTKPELEELITT